MGLTLGMNLKFYISVAKVLKLKVEKFLGLIPIFVGVTGEKLVVVVGGGFLPLPPIVNRVKDSWNLIGLGIFPIFKC